MFDELHVTLAPLMVVPFWSLTVADSWDVARSGVKLRLVAESVIEVATGVGVVGGAVVLSPQHAGSNSTAVSRMYLMFSICAPLLYPRQRGDPSTPGPPFSAPHPLQQ